jgi:hypothetical protein
VSQPKGIIHVLITAFRVIRGLRWATVTKQKNTHEFRQAAQLWRLEVVEFAIETGPFSARRFLFLLQGIIMQGTAIRMQLETKKGVNAIG